MAWGNRIFVTCSNDENDLGYLVAVNESDGKLLWEKEFLVSDLTMHKDNNLASPSPAVDESHVYVIWYSQQKTSLYAIDHEVQMQWELEFEGIEARHGGGSSLMLTEQYVIFTREQEENSSLAGT